MSGPGDSPFIEHTPPKAFPATSLVGVAVPSDFNRVLITAAKKNDILYEDQLLKWAQMGAECSRLHEAKKTRTRRNR